MLTVDELLQLFARDHSFYDKGWMPGPNALWQHKSPDEMARSLHHGSKEKSDPSSLLGRESPALKQEPKTASPMQGRMETALRNDPLAGNPQSQLAVKPFKPLGEQTPIGETAPAGKPEGDQSAAVPPNEEPKSSDKPQETPEAEQERQPQIADPMAEKRANDLFGGLKGAATGKPVSVVKGISGVASQWSMKAEDREDMINDANMAVFKAFAKETPTDPEAVAYTVSRNAALDYVKKRKSGKRDIGKTKQMGEGFDAVGSNAKKKGDVDESSVNEFIANLPPVQRKILQAKVDGFKGKALAKELGMSEAGVTREFNKIKSLMDAKGLDESHFLHAKFGDKDRYMNENHEPAGSPEGGQFTGKAEDGQSPDDMAKKLQHKETIEQTAWPESVGPDEPEGDLPSQNTQPRTRTTIPGQQKPVVYPPGVQPAVSGRYITKQESDALQAQGDTPFCIKDKSGSIVGFADDENYADEQAKELGGTYDFDKENAAANFDWKQQHQPNQPVVPKSRTIATQSPRSQQTTTPSGNNLSNEGVFVRGFHDKSQSDKQRYVMPPVRPEIWAEILEQSNQYGPMGPEFIRCVMEAMGHVDGQYEAIVEGRRNFLTGMTRHEYGPRHQPPKRIDGAIARLEALMEYSEEIDEESLESEVDGIAREFSADDLKEIARKFGVKRGLATKMIAMEKILAKVCEGN